MSGVRISADELMARLSHHTMDETQVAASTEVRAAAKELAATIVNAAPPGRETSLAVTHVEEALMWANKAIARGES
jgi:hypothetical protein